MLTLTFALQSLSTPLLLCVGLVSRAVAARPPMNDPFHRAAWRVVGVMFVVFGIDLFIGNILQVLAFVDGTPSPALTFYLRVAPVLNHSRTFLALGGLAALVVLAVLKAPPGPRYWRLAWALLGVGLALGAVLGVIEGPFSITGHLFAVVLWDVVELLVILSTLFVLLVTNRADRWLWALLAAYASGLALGIFGLQLLIRFGIGWNPPTWTIHAVRDFFYATMLAAAFVRLRAARRGRPVHGMLGPDRAAVRDALSGATWRA
ncbi:MAG TPA: hypothetical protein VEX86_18110 [Longimicrobium sp.]|nr:hypothetical protein [Longimicrobium sp.]